MRLYVFEFVDQCTSREDGLICGYPESEHPFVGPGAHEFEDGAINFRLATEEEIKQACCGKEENDWFNRSCVGPDKGCNVGDCSEQDCRRRNSDAT